jgi:hypothetical protein
MSDLFLDTRFVVHQKKTGDASSKSSKKKKGNAEG